MSHKPFGRFIQQEDKGARKKERIRQEKKLLRAETRAYFEKKKAAVKGARFEEKEKEKEKQKEKGKEKEFGKGKQRERKSFGKRIGNREDLKEKEKGKQKEQEKDFGERTANGREREFENGKQRERKVFGNASATRRVTEKEKGKEKQQEKASKESSEMPLNKFIAHCGVCSRREAADWVKSGKVTVNNTRILEPGHKVTSRDEVRINGKAVHLRRNLVYILLNKPKDCITTTDDPRGRKTVLDIVHNATTERVYPVGRLDRNTTGVLLLTNDGELTQKLAHPRFEVRKIYEVTLDKVLSNKDFDSIARGITLEDGFIAPDALAWPVPGNKQIVGIEIHSGRNRIVRRIFEQLGYEIKALDRVLYGNLTKKNVERGKWRFLSEKEVRLLKYLNASYKKRPQQ